MTDELKDFSNPEKLKAFFEELDEENENLMGLVQSAHAENNALRVALMAVLAALDDRMPAVRDIVVHALDEATDRAENPLSGHSPLPAEEKEIEALRELRTNILLANKLIERE
jgi:ElaB/YqjD/DUF883 family membrane-anchored ribosome-binding protein